MGDTLFFLLTSFLQKENIHLNQDELKLQLLSHPSYPSLHSVTGVLGHFNIKNMALEVPKNRETLFQLPTSFISIIIEKNEFVIVTQHENNIELLYSNKKKKIVSLDEFLEMWSGIIVVIEKDTFVIPNKKVTNTTLLNSVYVLSAIVILGLFFITKPSLFQSTHFVLSLIGIGISSLIVKHELGFQSKAIDKFCTATESTSCDAVLNSKGASISKHFKLSDINLIYFIGIALSWLFLVNFSTNNSTIIIISLITVPITLYSIYYQYIIIKKWCPLCLGIVAVLWLQCCTLFLAKTSFISIKLDFNSSFILFFSFLITATLWLFIKPLLKKQQELEKLEIEHYKFKRNFELFNAVYSKNEIINTQPIDSKEIVLGNKNALLRILIVTNPSCFYCKEAHTDLENILKKNSDTINITIRFNINIKDKNSIAHRVTEKLIEIYNTESEELCIDALHEVYKSDVDLDKWIFKWGEPSNGIFNNLLKMQQDWCHENSINFTPALYVNGKQFPKEYNRSDLNYFIEDLIEQNESNSIESTKNEKELV
ncbi:MAG: thioredoxin domain-containing protein [Flavobacteriaceae bacterium]|nr:thioredoxin domain-containing protein [Flavobacteriaceae bacterium]